MKWMNSFVEPRLQPQDVASLTTAGDLQIHGSQSSKDKQHLMDPLVVHRTSGQGDNAEIHAIDALGLVAAVVETEAAEVGLA